MNEVAFVERREPDWQRLSYLLDRADASIRQLSSQELHEFVLLYRRASADLSLARTRSVNVELVAFLNDLVGRAYTTMYRSPRQSALASVALGVAMAAQAVRRLKWFVLASAMTLILSAVWGYYVVSIRPKALDVIVPPGQMREVFNMWKTGKHQEATAGTDIYMTSFYVGHNPAVSIVTGAAAASTFGVFSAVNLYQNGILLGALVHEVQQVNHVDHLLYSIAPHGVTEMSGMVLAGASGYSIGWALICPGRRKRGAALAAAAKDALIVLCASVVLMFMAAPVEGFFSFNPHVPNLAKAAFALLSAIAWAIFWTGYGRRDVEPAR